MGKSYEGYMSHNPPYHINIGGASYELHNTFKTKKEANDEIEFSYDMFHPKSHWKITPHYEGFAVYIREKKEGQ